jgi:integrase
MEELDNKDIKFIFPALRPNCSTQLVLKSPKTESSVRKIYIPKTLAYILRRWKDEQAQIKEFMGSDYTDYNFVVTMTNGRPVENRVIDRALRDLEIRENLPLVVFHSLRHSSATYKLKLGNVSMKDLQREGGWSTTEMIHEVYTHSIEEDRRGIAQKFDEAFYEGGGFDLSSKSSPQSDKPAASVNNVKIDVEALVEMIQTNPQLAQALKLAMNTSD